MHVLTKILVVFCAVLSLLLAALTMAFATNADRIRSSFDAERAQKVALEAQQKEQISTAASEKTLNEARLQASDNDKRSLNEQLSQLSSERTTLRSEVATAQANADSLRNQISEFGPTMATQTALIKNYRDEVTRLRDDLVKATKREIELVDRINDLTGQREVLEQNSRALKEQLEETKLSIQTSQKAGGSSGAGGGGVAMPEAREFAGPPVKAAVTDITSSPTGDLVVINEGSNRGLRDNTLMHVVRGNDFVASIVLVRVEPSTSVGRITLLRKGMQVLKDDVVLSRLQ